MTPDELGKILWEAMPDDGGTPPWNKLYPSEQQEWAAGAQAVYTATLQEAVERLRDRAALHREGHLEIYAQCFDYVADELERQIPTPPGTPTNG